MIKIFGTSNAWKFEVGLHWTNWLFGLVWDKGCFYLRIGPFHCGWANWGNRDT